MKPGSVGLALAALAIFAGVFYLYGGQSVILDLRLTSAQQSIQRFVSE